MTWRFVPLRMVAPPGQSTLTLEPDAPTWMLTLDQIESQTGSIVNKRIAPAHEAGPSTYVFDDTMVLYSKLRPYLNKVLAPDEPGIATTELVPLQPRPKLLLRPYLKFYLRSRAFVAEASQFVAGVKMPRIMMDKLWSHELPLPPPLEQWRIVEILDQADSLRRERAEADAKAERILPALFYSIFGEPATNPKRWTPLTLDDVVTDTQYGTSQKAHENGRGIAVIRMNNIDRAGRLDLADLKYVELEEAELRALTLEPGDLLFNRTNSRELVGKTGLWSGDLEAVPASYLIRARVNRSEVLPEYVWAWMNTPYMKQILFGKARRAIGMANINSRELRSLPILKPPRDLQIRFAAQLKAMLEIDAQRACAALRLNRLFDTLLHRAFTGELTAKWRAAHAKELLAEMEEQARLLNAVPADAAGPKVTQRNDVKPRRHAGHDMYNKAALAAYIAHRCHNPQQPIGRTKMAKLFYLVQRRAGLELTEEFAHRAAGPLDDAIHKFLNLARKKRWVKLPAPRRTNASGPAPLKPVLPGDANDEAVERVRTRFADHLPQIDVVLEALGGRSWQELECWATVDAAAMTLLADGRRSTVTTVKSELAADPDWKLKLRKPAFSDANIAAALRGLQDMGFLPATQLLNA